MNLKKVALSAIFMSGTIFSFGQSSQIIPDFKGIKLGANLSEVSTILWGGDATRALKESRGIETTNSFIKIEVPKSSDRDLKFSCTIAGEPATISFWFDREKHDNSLSKLYIIRIFFDKKSILTVLSGLEEKFGKPKTTEDGMIWSFSGRRYSVLLANSAYYEEGRIFISDEPVKERVGRKHIADQAAEENQRKKDL